MRKAQKQKILGLIDSMHQMHESIESALERKISYSCEYCRTGIHSLSRNCRKERLEQVKTFIITFNRFSCGGKSYEGLQLYK